MVLLLDSPLAVLMRKPGYVYKTYSILHVNVLVVCLYVLGNRITIGVEYQDLVRKLFDLMLRNLKGIGRVQVI